MISQLGKSAHKKSQPKKKSRQQEREEYEKKYLIESETNVTWEAYDVKAKKKVKIQNPKVVMMKNGKWADQGHISNYWRQGFQVCWKQKTNCLS